MLARIKNNAPRRSRAKNGPSVKKRPASMAFGARPVISAPTNFQHTTHVPSPVLPVLPEEPAKNTTTTQTAKTKTKPAVPAKPVVAAKPVEVVEICQQEMSGDIQYEGAVWTQVANWEESQEWSKHWAVVERINSSLLALLIYGDCNRGHLKKELEIDVTVAVRKCAPTYGQLHVAAVASKDDENKDYFLAFADEANVNTWMTAVDGIAKLTTAASTVQEDDAPPPLPSAADKPPPIPPRRMSQQSACDMAMWPNPAAEESIVCPVEVPPTPAKPATVAAECTPMKITMRITSKGNALTGSLEEARRVREQEEDEFEALCSSPGGVFSALGFEDAADGDKAGPAIPAAKEEVVETEAPADGTSSSSLEELADVPRSPVLECPKRLKSPSTRKPSRLSWHGNKTGSGKPEVGAKSTKASPLAGAAAAVEATTTTPNCIQLGGGHTDESTVDTDSVQKSSPPPVPAARKSQLQLIVPLEFPISLSTDTDTDAEDWACTASFSPMHTPHAVSIAATIEEEMEALRRAFEIERLALEAEREKSANLEKQVKRLKMQLQRRNGTGKTRMSVAAKHRQSFVPAYPPPPPPRNSMASF